MGLLYLGIKYILNTMADPNGFDEQEMMGSFVQEGHQYQSGLGSEFSEDIKATAHFTHAQINNINGRNDLMENSESPVNRFQLANANMNTIQGMRDYSLQDSGRQNPQYLNASGSVHQNPTPTQNYRKAESLPSSGAEQVEVEPEQPSQAQQPHGFLTEDGSQSIGLKLENQKQIQKSHTQNNSNMYVKKDQGQKQHSKRQGMDNYFKTSQTIQKAKPQRQLYQSEPIQKTPENQRQLGVLNNQNQAINIQQAVFSQVMLSQPHQRSSESIQQIPNSQSAKSNMHGVQIQRNSQLRHYQQPVVGSPYNSTSHNPNRYFAAVGSQEQKLSPSQFLLNSPSSSRSNLNVALPIVSAPETQKIGHSQVQAPQFSQNKKITTSTLTHQQHSVLPTSPYRAETKPQTPTVIGYPQQVRSPKGIDKPKLTVFQGRPSEQNVLNSNSPPFRSPNSSSQQPVPPGPARQSRILGNDQSGLVYGSRRSISYGSADSKGKPAVYFTYSSNVGSSALDGKKTRVSGEHTRTVVEKTITVVWEHRYLTMIQKFHFICERFSWVVKQVKLVTQLLEGAKGREHLEGLYRDLLIRHTGLLETLSQCQHEMSRFEQESKWYNREIQYEAEVKEQSLYKDKYQQLEYENKKLQHELKLANEQIRMLSSRSAPSAQAEFKHLESRTQKMQQELAKSQALSEELQQYIKKLEHEYNQMSSEVQRAKGGEKNIIEYANLIKNQQLIIRQLEEEVKKLQQRKQPEPTLVQQYIRTIGELEAKVKQLELNSLPPTNAQVSEQKYTEIIENQRNIIQNIDYHFKQFERGAAAREEELKGILKHQESIIVTLEDQLRSVRADSPTLTKQREQALLRQLEDSRGKSKQLQLQVEKLQEKNNAIKYQLEIKVAQVVALKDERVTYQRSMQQKLQQKLVLIEQELKLRGNQAPKIQPSPSTPKFERSQQLQQLMQDNDRLASDLRKRQQQKRKLEQEMISQDENMRRKLLQKQSQVRLLNDKIKLSQDENKRRFLEKDRKIKQLQEEIDSLTSKVKSNVSTPRHNQNNQNFDTYSPQVSNQQQVRSLKDRLSQKEQEALEFQRQKENIDKKFQVLQLNFNNLDEENVKKTQELMNLKRQFSSFSTFDNEIKTLTETVNKKNQQILELKSVSFEKNELKIELESIKNERNSLKATIQSKVQQIDKLKQTISEFQAKIRESKNRQSLFPTNSNQSAVQQLQIMYESMKKKEAELIKIKQANQLLETNVQELQYQLERAKAKIVTLQKNHTHDKEDHVNSVAEYEKLIKELEAKTKSLDESQRINKTNFNAELQNLDNALKEKQEIIRRLEGENKVLKNKLKNHDSKTQEYESEIQNLNKKVKQIEAARDELKKQIEASESGNQHNNKKLYDQYQIKIVELEASIKVKDNKIKQLQNNFETLKLKAGSNNQAEQDFINQQQIQVLRKKVAEYESRLYNFGGSRINNYKPRDYESTLVFEQKAIYDLKAENERLKSMISSKSIKYPSGEGSPQKVNADFIQKRLIDFNQRLEEMIEENRSLEQKNIDYSALLEPRHQNQQMISSFQRQRLNLLKKHRAQISALQARMVDLQRYCSTLQFVPNNTSTYSYTSNTKYLDSAKSVYAEQLNYYKQKNKELEERIDEHIKINKELKQKLGAASRAGGDANAIEFYRMQVSQMEREIAEYLMKIKSLTDQGSRLRLVLQTHKNDQSSELKISQLENRVHELNRKIAQLQMQNGILQSDLQKYMQQLKITNEQSQKHRSYGVQKDQKLNSLDQVVREANSKINNYEIQVVKLSNQIKLLEAETERLNEKNKNRQAEESTQISKLKARLVQLQSEIREHEEHSNAWNQAKASYQQTISTLQSRIANLQAEVTRLNALYGNLSKKAKDSDGEFFELQNRLQAQRNKANQLEALLQRKQADIDTMNQFLQRIKKERDNEGTQSKQRLAYISEMEEALRSLRGQILQYKSQLERLKAENNEAKQRLYLLGNLQEIVKQLRLEIQLHKGQIQRMKSANEQLRQKAGMNMQSEQEILKYSVQIERLRREDQRGQAQLSKLRIYIEKLERELRANQEFIQKFAYRLEFIRKVLSEGFIVDEGNRRQVQLLEKCNSSIAKGLSICSETFAML